MFNIAQFQSSAIVRLMCDAVLLNSGDDDVTAAIDTVPGVVQDAALALGATLTEAELVGRWWCLELFYGYDSTDGERYAPSTDEEVEVCKQAVRDLIEDYGGVGVDGDDLHPLVDFIA